MKRSSRWFAAGLVLVCFVAYAAWLVGLQVVGGESGLRPYVTDLEGPVALYALNTSLSAGLLVVAATIWAATRLVAGNGQAGTRLRWFGMLEAAVLVGLAADDRFLIHERVGRILGIEDALVIGAAGLVQVVLLIVFADIGIPDLRSRVLVGAAGAMVVAMLSVDAFGGEGLPLRLAMEEVSKVWASGLIAWWAWVRLADLSATRSDLAPASATS